jgi:RNA polymerase sigma-70 factor (ECF subfamily)
MLESQGSQAAPPSTMASAMEQTERAPADNPGAPDETLALQSKRGDRGAFEELLRRTSRMVYAQFLLDLGDAHRAEDLTQETYLNAWRAIGTLNEPAGFRAWLMAIARSILIDYLRRAQRKKRAGKTAGAEALEQVPDASPEPSEQLDVSEERERALEILRTLPEDYRRPLMLRYLGGADYNTIGKQLGISSGALRGLLSRGLALLRSKMKREP